jgi:hypothetical protein
MIYKTKNVETNKAVPLFTLAPTEGYEKNGNRVGAVSIPHVLTGTESCVVWKPHLRLLKQIVHVHQKERWAAAALTAIAIGLLIACPV